MKKGNIIDERGRLFGLISVIDVAVILAVVVTAAAVYLKFNALPLTSTAAPLTPITYQLTITNMPEGRLLSLREGDYLYDNDNDTRVPIGVINAIEVEDCYLPSTLLDGSYVMGRVEERYNVILTITDAECIVDSIGRIYINRTNEIGLGMSINFYTKTCIFAATVSQIDCDEL